MHDCIYLFEGKCPCWWNKIFGRCNGFCKRYVSINTKRGTDLIDKIKESKR